MRRFLVVSFLLLALTSVILAASGKPGYCSSAGSDSCTSQQQTAVTNTLNWEDVELNAGLVLEETEEEVRTLATSGRKIIVVQETIPTDATIQIRSKNAGKTYCYTSCEWFYHNDGSTVDRTSWNANQVCYGCNNGYIRYDADLTDGICLKFPADYSKVSASVFDEVAAGCKTYGGCKYCTAKKPVLGKVQHFAQISKVLADDPTSTNANGVFVPSARGNSTYAQVQGEIKQTGANVQVYKELPNSPRILPEQASIDEQIQAIGVIALLKLTLEEWKKKFRDTFSLIMDEVNDAIDEMVDLRDELKQANKLSIGAAKFILQTRQTIFGLANPVAAKKRNYAQFVAAMIDEMDEAVANSSQSKKIADCIEDSKKYKESIKEVKLVVQTDAKKAVLDALKLLKSMFNYQNQKCFFLRFQLGLDPQVFLRIANRPYDSTKNY